MTDNLLIDKLNDRIHQFEKFKQDTSLLKSIELMEGALRQGNKILVFGNGGSATQASHFAAELVNKFYFQRKALPALALTTDIATLTSIANDINYDAVFSRQVEALGQVGDVAVGLSTSGKSPNVLQALAKAKDSGLKTVAICGDFIDNLHKLQIDVIIPIQSHDTPVIQELHLFILHIMAECLEKNLCRS
jgi:D-sedoheptulose 7-phosphate isomerase